jgi:hypothetical protein
MPPFALPAAPSGPVRAGALRASESAGRSGVGARRSRSSHSPSASRAWKSFAGLVALADLRRRCASARPVPISLVVLVSESRSASSVVRLSAHLPEWKEDQSVPRPRQEQSSERQGLDLAVSGLDQAVAVLDAEIGAFETQLKNRRDERRELQQTRARLTKLGGDSSSAVTTPPAAAGRRARTRATRSGSAASAAPAAAATPRRARRRSAGRASAAEREAAIIEAITGRPMTAVETATAVGLSRPRARQILKELRDSGRLRVEEVSSGRGRPRLVYHAGSNRASSSADSGERSAPASAASTAASPSSSTGRRSDRRRRTTPKRSSGGQPRASRAAAETASTDPAAHTAA